MANDGFKTYFKHFNIALHSHIFNKCLLSAYYVPDSPKIATDIGIVGKIILPCESNIPVLKDF